MPLMHNGHWMKIIKKKAALQAHIHFLSKAKRSVRSLWRANKLTIPTDIFVLYNHSQLTHRKIDPEHESRSTV